MTVLPRVTAIALLLCSSAVLAQTTPGALHQKGRAAMEAGSHAEAEILFRRAIALEPSVVQHRISLAEALIAQQRLREAEAILAAIPPASRTRQGDLLLAQVRLWLGRLAEAAEGFRALTSANPGHVEAREGLARALYWAGDWPAAAAEYRSVLAIQPENEAARQALAEISIVSAAHAEAGVSIARDDQPYRRARSFVSFSPATESLTRWRVEAGSWFLDAEANDVSAT
ncbi:MAG: tetratricopeptide repeat protein, partial [Acidobacteria bacterium]|nr:tetratricopeptide repeat protein [Acidobacteriota bacterium]